METERVNRSGLKLSVVPVLLVTGLLCGLMVAGCASSGAGTEGSDGGRVRVRSLEGHVHASRVTAAGLLASSRPLIEDLPVPIGFKLLESVSVHEVDDESGERRVDHSYEGRAGRVALDRFYGREMVAAGWEAAYNRMEEGGEMVLGYVKGAEVCEIRVLQGVSGTGAGLTRVRYSVRPDGAG